MERTSAATFRAAFDQGHDGVLVGIAALDRPAFLLADEGFIDLDLHAFPAKLRQRAGLHGLAQPVRHEPGSPSSNRALRIKPHATWGAAENLRPVRQRPPYPGGSGQRR